GEQFRVTRFESWVTAVMVGLTVPVFFFVCAWVFVELDRSTYQTAGSAQANCSSGPYVNCNTIYRAPQQDEKPISRVDGVDGVGADNGLIYTITCSAKWVGSHCTYLNDGQGKQVRVKYKILDIR